MSVIMFQECGHIEHIRAMLRVYDNPVRARVVTCIHPVRDPSDRQWVNGPKILSWKRDSSSIRFFSEPLTVPDGFLPATLRLIDASGIALTDMAWTMPGVKIQFTLLFGYKDKPQIILKTPTT